jgi:hypothetical protein
MTKKASESFDEGVETPDEAFVDDGENAESIDDIAPETIRNATTTRRRIEDYLEERQIARLTDEFDFGEGRPKKKKGAK